MLSNKNEKRQQPLMYIVQPETIRAEANMQQVAVRKKPIHPKTEKKAPETEQAAAPPAEAALDTPQAVPEENLALNETAEEVLKLEEAVPVSPVHSERPPEEAKIEKAPEEVKIEKAPDEGKTVSSKPVYERKTRKTLNQMSVAEKIAFFANLPANIPRTLCQVELPDQTYRGIILGETDGMVQLRTTASSQPVQIKSEDIQAIQPLGF
ncbi:CotO family spore coat protein [Bacillus sp. FJAT-42376]|uniref:CotO family spore coat protein n=1 Tax=Bacillus sp. FJAT-42376 TaxID=2014076 RepID=UPI0013DDE46C|nr:CotO family spore coat protein [Bacillus sp. FJAT-42376]